MTVQRSPVTLMQFENQIRGWLGLNPLTQTDLNTPACSSWSNRMSLSRRRTRSDPKCDLQGEDKVERTQSGNLQLARTSLSKKILNATIPDQEQMANEKFRQMYPQVNPKEIQLNTTVPLLNGLNVFLLAATGFGKSWVSELFFHMFPRSKRAVILVLNPLDALGDNQVCGTIQ